jgi:hypothetical protein
MRCRFSLFGCGKSLFAAADTPVGRTGKPTRLVDTSLSPKEKFSRDRYRTKQVPCRREFPAASGNVYARRRLV